MASKEELGLALQAAHEAGDEEGARTLATAYAAADEKPLGFSGTLKGIGDVALSTARGLVNKPAESLAALGTGLGGMAAGGNFNEEYMRGLEDARREVAAGKGIVKDEALRTPEGARVALAIGNAPGFKQVGQALDTIGGGIEKYAGPAARDMVGSAATLATLRTPYVPTPTTVSARTVLELKNAGATIPPGTSIGAKAVSGTATERALSKYAGTIEASASVQNAPWVDGLAAKAGGLETATVTPAAMKVGTEQAESAYGAMRKFDVPVVLQTPQFINDVADLGKRVAGFSDATDKGIIKLQQSLLTAQPTVPNIIDKVLELRRDSFVNKAADNPAKRRLGAAQQKAAELLDGSLDSAMQRLAQRHPGVGIETLYKNYVAARGRLSTLHIIRDSMNPTTGTIDAGKLAAEVAERKVVDPRLSLIAKGYNVAPKAFQPVERAAPASTQTVGAVGMTVGAGVGASVGSAMGMPGVGAVIGSLAVPLSRMLAKQYVMRSKRARLLTKAAGQANRSTARTIAGQQLVEDEQP